MGCFDACVVGLGILLTRGYRCCYTFNKGGCLILRWIDPSTGSIQRSCITISGELCMSLIDNVFSDYGFSFIKKKKGKNINNSCTFPSRHLPCEELEFDVSLQQIKV